MNIQKKLLFSFFFLFASFSVFANPFTGNKNSPSPVQQGKPNKTITEGQRFLHERLGDYIQEWKNDRSIKDLALILFFAFLYGILHAIGPGHRKTVIFSFYLTRSSPMLEPLWVASILAFSHAGVALVLAFIFSGVAGAISVNANDASIYMEASSFILLILLSFFSILHVVFEHIIKGKHEITAHREKIKLGTLLLSGLYPCPAALLVLVLTFALDIVGIGVLAIIAMSFGMCIPITISGYIAWMGRKKVFEKLRN